MEDFVLTVARMAARIEELEVRIARLEAMSGECRQDSLPRGFLPAELRLKPTQLARLDALIREDYVRVEGRRLVWNSGNVTLLAFACGILWAGDRVTKAKGGKDGDVLVLVQGRGSFPAAGLERLFSVKNLKQSRRNIFMRSGDGLTVYERDAYNVMMRGGR